MTKYADGPMTIEHYQRQAEAARLRQGELAVALDSAQCRIVDQEREICILRSLLNQREAELRKLVDKNRQVSR